MVTGDQVRRTSLDGSSQYRPVLLSKLDPGPLVRSQRGRSNSKDAFQQPIQSLALLGLLEVPSRFLHRILGRDELSTLPPPKPRHASVCTVGSREQHVGVEEEPVHRLDTGWTAMGDFGGIQPHAPYGFLSPSVVVRVDCVRE